MELLAPVGNINALYAAIKGGADAVYLGLDCFNARAKAQGFDKDNIAYNTRLCHLYGVKVYVTFNIAVKQRELALFEEYVKACAEAKVDAFIVADLGTLKIFRKYGVPLHASTQMGIHNLEGAQFMQDLGFTRVVVARETTVEDIKKIKRNTDLEVEYFVHGALCVCFSGSCLLSSMMSGDSGNRGRCNQPCRLPYKSSFGKQGYLLSPSEQCLIQKLDALDCIGVDSLKVEGRLKQPYYVYEVVSAYRRVLDGKKADEKDIYALKKVFNRGEFTSGYMFDATKDIMSYKVQGNIGVSIGKVISSDKRGLTVRCDCQLHDGDGIKIMQNGAELGGFGVKIKSSKSNLYTIECKDIYPLGAQVRRTLDVTCLSDDYTSLEKLPVTFRVSVDGDNVRFCITRNSVKVSLDIKATESQNGNGTDMSIIKDSLGKLGDTVFYANDVIVEGDTSKLFLRKSEINSVRRQLVEMLEQKLADEYAENMPKASFTDSAVLKNNDCKDIKESIIVNTDDFAKLVNINDKKIAISYQIFDFSRNNSQSIINFALNHNNLGIYLHLPPVCRGKDIEALRKLIESTRDHIQGLICENWYAVQLAKEYGLNAVGGIRLNVFNAYESDIAGLDSFVFSPELTLQEMKDIGKNGFVYAYGLLPVMTFCHCPVQLNTGCTCKDCKYVGDFTYSDKKADYLIKRTKVMSCQFEMYNPSVVDIGAKSDKIPFNLYINMVNCNCTASEVIDNISRGNRTYAQGQTTTAHLFRGVK